MFPDPGIDLNQSCSIPQQSFGRAVGNRFPRQSCSLDDTGCSWNRHATLYTTDTQSESAGMLLDQRKTELPRSNGDDLGMADQHKYYTKTLHKMRNPTVDPRKSRRHGTDFGLGRCTESSLTVLNSDHQNTTTSVSVPFTTMQDNTATDGESVSSLFECSALDFPQPPPIGNSVVRRMCSSPWFSDKGCLNREFSNQVSQWPRRSASVLLDSDVGGPCHSVASFVTQLPTIRRENLRSGRHSSSNIVDEAAKAERARSHLSQYFDPEIDNISLEMVGEALVGLDMNASNMVPQKLYLDNPAYDVPSCEFSQASDSGLQFVKSSHLDRSTSSDLLRWSTSHRSLPIVSAPMPQQRICGWDSLQSDGYEYHAFRTKTKPLSSPPSGGIHSLGRLPRIIRKVASMRTDTRRPDDPNCVPPGSRGPKMISKPCSSRSIPLVACEADNNAYNAKFGRGPHQHSNWSFTNLDCFPFSEDGQDLKCQFSSPTLNDSLRSFEQCEEHMPVPPSGLEKLGSEVAQHKAKATANRLMALSTPFVHRGTCNRPPAGTENELSKGTEKSFINITPNQGTKHQRSPAATKRARVKKLIARASDGIIGWGRQLTRKNSHAG